MEPKPLVEGSERDARRSALNRMDLVLTVIGAVFFGFVLTGLFVFFGFGIDGWGQ